MVYSASGLNYFQLGPISGLTAGAYTNGTTGMTPIQAFNIDTKLDDGKPPESGIVQARALDSINGTPNQQGAA